MNRKLKQFFRGISVAAMMMIITLSQAAVVYAASGRIAFSDKSESVGKEISINMKITSDGGEALSNATVMLNYDASMLEFVSGTGASGGAGAIRITVTGDTADAKTLNSTLKFNTLQAGTAKVTVTSQEVYDSANQIVSIERMGDSTVNISALANASQEASLAELKISPGTLTPEFSPEVQSYTASVGTDVTKITVSAPAADSKAKVVISGGDDLQSGENQVVCKVIAEDGQTVKDYTITVTKGEGGESGAAGASVDVVTAAKTVTIIPPEAGVEIPQGFKECLLKINGQEVKGWVWASDKDYQYCIFYGVNEAGEKGFYRYDIKEKTMQRYFQDPMAEGEVSMEQYATVATQYNNLLGDYKIRLYIIIALTVVSVALLIAVIVLLSKRGKHYDDDDKYGNYKEKLDTRQRPTRKITREEQYMRGLEEEEGLRKTEDSQTGFRQSMEEDEPVRQPVVKTMARTGGAKRPAASPSDDDDFEFIELDL